MRLLRILSFPGLLLCCALAFGSDTDISALKAKAESGDVRSQVSLARAYEKGVGVTQNDEEAVKWLRRAAEKDDAEAEGELGVMYRTGRGVDQNKAEAVKWYHKSALQGYALAMFNLAASYYNGDGVQINDTHAYSWFLLAERAGSRNATEAAHRMESELPPSRIADIKLFLATELRKGEAMPHDPVFAVELLRSVPSSGEARFQLGCMYAEGDGVPQDYTEALRNLTASSLPEAQDYLASMYFEGKGVPRDPEKGLNLLRKAAERIPAIHSQIGSLYWNGSVFPRDYGKALKSYENAANVGDSTAFYMLGVAARDGLGTKRDAIRACSYFLLATNVGNTLAEREAGTACNSDNLERAKKTAHEWLGKHRVALTVIETRQRPNLRSEQ